MTSEDKFSSQNNAGVSDLGQDIEDVEDVRVGHQGQVNEVLDLPASNLGPDTIVFAPYFVAGRMRRPIRAAASQEFKAYLHPAIAPIQSGVKREPQTCDDSDVVSASCSLRQHRKPIFGRHHLCGQQFAVRHKVFDIEDELVVAVPGLLG